MAAYALAGAAPVAAQTEASPAAERSYCPPGPASAPRLHDRTGPRVGRNRAGRLAAQHRQGRARRRLPDRRHAGTDRRVRHSRGDRRLDAARRVSHRRPGDRRARHETTRIGDALVGAKLNLANPDGSGVSFAIQPFVSLPVGREPVGAGGLGRGHRCAADDRARRTLQPAVHARDRLDRQHRRPGRHWAYSGVVAWASRCRTPCRRRPRARSRETTIPTAPRRRPRRRSPSAGCRATIFSSTWV
ncbi:hypothetical protein AB5I41_09165 [Sphingomonas sp. MMS24-JH45]